MGKITCNINVGEEREVVKNHIWHQDSTLTCFITCPVGQVEAKLTCSAGFSGCPNFQSYFCSFSYCSMSTFFTGLLLREKTRGHTHSVQQLHTSICETRWRPMLVWSQAHKNDLVASVGLWRINWQWQWSIFL